MGEPTLGAIDFFVFCSVGFFVVCILIAYLLYWFVRKSKSERYSKIKVRSRKSKSLGKGTRRSKIADEPKAKAPPKKAAKKDEEPFVERAREERKTKDQSSSSSSDKSLRQAEEDFQAANKFSSEQPLDSGVDMKSAISKQQPGALLMPSEYGVDVGQSSLQPPQKTSQMSQRLPSEATKPSKAKSLVLVEPNKFLKEAGIGLEHDRGKDRLKSFGSRVDSGRSTLNTKKMDSVVAYHTSPINMENIAESEIAPSLLNSPSTAPSSKFMSKAADTSPTSKNTASILSVANSQLPREGSEPFILQSNLIDKNIPSSKEAFKSTTSASSTGTKAELQIAKKREDRHDLKRRQKN